MPYKSADLFGCHFADLKDKKKGVFDVQICSTRFYLAPIPRSSLSSYSESARPPCGKVNARTRQKNKECESSVAFVYIHNNNKKKPTPTQWLHPGAACRIIICHPSEHACLMPRSEIYVLVPFFFDLDDSISTNSSCYLYPICALWIVG